MAAENGDPPKDRGQMSGDEPRTRPGVTLDLEAQAAVENPKATNSTAVPETATEPAGEPDLRGADESGTSAEGPGGGSAPPASVSGSPEPAREHHSVAALVIAGLIGGAVALALGYGLQTSGVLPSPGETAANAAMTEAEGVKTDVSAIDQRLTSIEAASAQSIADRALLDDLSRQVGVVDALGESLSDRLLKSEASIAALTDDSGNDETKQTLDALSGRVAQLESAPAPDDQSSAALTEMSKRVDALEESLAQRQAEPATEASPEATASAPPADRAVAVAAFQQAASAGGPFPDALDQLDTLGVDAEAVAALKPLAEKGAPSRAELTAAFPGVADAIVAAEPTADSEAGLLDRLTSYGRNLVRVRPAGADPDAEVVARMKTAVEAGDFAEALAERKGLPEEGQAASQTWADAVADRLEIDRLAEEIIATADAGGGSG